MDANDDDEDTECVVMCCRVKLSHIGARTKKLTTKPKMFSRECASRPTSTYVRAVAALASALQLPPQPPPLLLLLVAR